MESEKPIGLLLSLYLQDSNQRSCSGKILWKTIEFIVQRMRVGELGIATEVNRWKNHWVKSIEADRRKQRITCMA
jgi:hypothetical protein